MPTPTEHQQFLDEMKKAARRNENRLAKATDPEEIAHFEGVSIGLIRAFRIFQAATGQTYDITGWFNPEN